MLACEETHVARLAELGIAKRLALMVLTGALALGAVTTIAVVGQRSLTRQAEVSRSLASALAALNHLDTRQSELKVDAYRAALGQDVAGDVADDVQSATEAADAVSAAGLPRAMAAAF